jgi:hypothetical protein
MPFSFKDGCAIAVRPSIEIEKAWRLPAEAFQPKVVQTRIAEEPIPNYEELPENLRCIGWVHVQEGLARFRQHPLAADVVPVDLPHDVSLQTCKNII